MVKSSGTFTFSNPHTFITVTAYADRQFLIIFNQRINPFFLFYVSETVPLVCYTGINFQIDLFFSKNFKSFRAHSLDAARATLILVFTTVTSQLKISFSVADLYSLVLMRCCCGLRLVRRIPSCTLHT